MATEQDERRGNGIMQAQHGAAHQLSHRQPWSWKIDISSFALSLIALGAIVGLVAPFDNTFRGYYFWPSSHWLRFGVGCLLLAIYFFLLVPLSNSFYRIRQIHSSYPTWVFSSSTESGAKLKQPFRAAHVFFSSSVLGIAPVPTIILLVAATVAVAPWTSALVEYQRYFQATPERFQRFTGANLPVAQRLDADRPENWPGYYQQRETIQAAVWKGFTGAAAEKPVRCFGYGGYTGVYCSWDGYATLQVRVQCGSIDQDLELSSAYSIFQAMRDVDSLPPYDPHHESEANHSFPSILSLKGNTFVTLSNLMSYTGPWREETEQSFGHLKDKKRQIKKEALKKLHQFSSLVINPVDSQKLKSPLFNQTAGVLGNFHIIQAELGIDGYYDEKGELDWIELERGDTAAWECTIDTVVQEKSATQNGDILYENDKFWSSPPVLPSTKEQSNRSCLNNPDSCSGDNRQDISYTWNGKQFSIDRRITDAMSYELEQTFLGSGFAQGWRSKIKTALPILQTSSQSALLILHRMQSAMYWNVMDTFGTVGETLTWWMRRYYADFCSFSPQSDGEEICRQSKFVGQTSEQTDYYHINWEYITYPVVLIAITLLVMIAAALDERWFSRIRLSDDGDDDRASGRSESDGPGIAASSRD